MALRQILDDMDVLGTVRASKFRCCGKRRVILRQGPCGSQLATIPDRWIDRTLAMDDQLVAFVVRTNLHLARLGPMCDSSRICGMKVVVKSPDCLGGAHVGDNNSSEVGWGWVAPGAAEEASSSRADEREL